MKIYLTAFITLLLTNQSYSQDTTMIKKTGYTVSMHKITLGSINGYEYEGKISNKSTISISAGMGVYFLKDNIDYNIKGQIAFFPAISTNYRYYYNISDRTMAKKNASENSANYLVGRIDLILANSEYTNNWLISQGWGLQRKLSKKTFFNLQLGITENLFKNYGTVEFRLQPLVNITIFLKV